MSRVLGSREKVVDPTTLSGAKASGFGVCPVPSDAPTTVILGHGSGGRLSHDLLTRVFLPNLGRGSRSGVEDQATLPFPAGGRLAITTDSFVIQPLEFPGGDIGSLAVHGSVNDLAVGGAKPLYLAASFILEEGLDLALLARVVRSMGRACDEVPIALVTGDTKVVQRGKGDGIFLTTTAVGFVPHGVDLSATHVRPGDRVLVSGTIGDHGFAVLAAREGIGLETSLASDSAPLHGVAQVILAASARTRAMRDATRGGVATVANEIAAASSVGIELWEDRIPLRDEVRGISEVLGLDPLYVANEGKLVAFVPREDEDAVLAAMRDHPLGRDAAVIGEVVAAHPGVVTSRSGLGAERIVPMLSGEQLPRIC